MGSSKNQNCSITSRNNRTSRSDCEWCGHLGASCHCQRNRPAGEWVDCAGDSVWIYRGDGCVPGKLYSTRGTLSRLCSCGLGWFGKKQIQKHHRDQRTWRWPNCDSDRPEPRGRSRDGNANPGSELVVLLLGCDP